MAKPRNNKKKLDEISDSDSDSEKMLEELELETSDVNDKNDIENQSDVENQSETDLNDEEKELSDDNCMYKYAYDETEEYDDEIFDEDDKKDNIVPANERITKPYMTKYERVRIIGDRTKILSLGAKPMIKNAEHLTSKEIAELELKYNIIPLIIERPLPNGKIERWHVKEFKNK